LLGIMSVVAIALFMTWNARGPWDFVLGFRGRKLWGLALAGYAIAVSTVLFQTVTANRILSPAIMGFDWLYQLIQTTLVFVFGGFAYATLDPQLRFAGDVVVMVALSVLLFRWLFGRQSRGLHLLVLVGIVFGILFRSISNLMQRLIDPNEFAVLQDTFFASFNAIEPTLLAVSTAATALLSLACHLMLERTVWPATAGQWLAVAGLGLMPVGAAFYAWDHGVKHGNIQVLGASSYAAPLLSTLVLIAAGAATASLNILAACLLITAGAVLAAKSMLFGRAKIAKTKEAGA